MVFESFSQLYILFTLNLHRLNAASRLWPAFNSFVWYVCFSRLHVPVFSGLQGVLHLCVSCYVLRLLLSKLMMPFARLSLADGLFGLVPSPPRLRNVIAVKMVALVCSCYQDGLYMQGKVHVCFSFLTAVGNENHVYFMPDIYLALQCVAILSVLEREESQSAGRKHSFFLSISTVSGRLLLRWVMAPFSKGQIKQGTGWLLLLIFISHLPLFWPLASKDKRRFGHFLKQAI